MQQYRRLPVVMQVASILLLLAFATGALWSWYQHRQQQGAPVAFLGEDTVWADSLLQVMSLEEKAAQLVIWKTTVTHFKEEEQLQELVHTGQLGGVLLDSMGMLFHLTTIDSLRKIAPIPLWVATEAPVLLNSQFADVPKAPSPFALASAHFDSLDTYLNTLYPQQTEALGINWAAPLRWKTDWRTQRQQLEILRVLNQTGVLTLLDGFAGYEPSPIDTSQAFIARMAPLRRLVSAGLPGIIISDTHWQQDSLPTGRNFYLQQYLRQYADFRGLLVARYGASAPLDMLLNAGIDVFLTELPPDLVTTLIVAAVKEGTWQERELNAKVRKVLQAKQWMRWGHERPARLVNRRGLKSTLPKERHKQRPTDTAYTATDRVWSHFREENWNYFFYDIYERSIILISNPGNQLPLNSAVMAEPWVVLEAGGTYADFRTRLTHYLNFQYRNIPVGTLASALEAIRKDAPNTHYVLLVDQEQEADILTAEVITKLNELSEAERLVIINFGLPDWLATLDRTAVILQNFDRLPVTEQLSAQVLVGGAAAKGILPYALGDRFPVGYGLTTAVSRLGFAPPEAVGVNPVRLVGIDAIVNNAIDEKAMPGAQVLVAKQGRIIYSRSFGSHTYDADQPVRFTDLYDIASLTKTSATTMLAMAAYDSQELDLDDRLDQHLPWLKNKPLGTLRLRELLTHQSGLQANLPIGAYVYPKSRRPRRCDTYFCDRERSTYRIAVAPKMFFNTKYLATIEDKIAGLKPRKNKSYRYSDLNFLLVQRVLEQVGKEPMDRQLARAFYSPMGLRTTGFNPYRRFSLDRIPPTENDKRWRRELVQGYVHDPAAALLGGVAGHAGLFSSAEDLAALYQMLLNGGIYGGKRYLASATVDLFTQKQPGALRGLGFDKPSKSNSNSRASGLSPASFGHTGFTGTCVWVDPEQELLFVFLSNRVFPDASNRKLFQERIRGRVHQVAYDALGTYAHHWPNWEVRL